MARTTGYTATAAANLFLEGLFHEKGVFPPELVGKHKACLGKLVGNGIERSPIFEALKAMNEKHQRLLRPRLLPADIHQEFPVMIWAF